LGGAAQNSLQSNALGAIPSGLVSSDPDAPGPVAYTGSSLPGLAGIIANIGNALGFGTGAPGITGQANVAPGVNANLGAEYSGLAPTGTPTPVNAPSPNTSDPGLAAGQPGFTGYSGSGAGGRYGFNAPNEANPFAPYFGQQVPLFGPRPNAPDPDPTMPDVPSNTDPTNSDNPEGIVANNTDPTNADNPEGVVSDGVTGPTGTGPVGLGETTGLPDGIGFGDDGGGAAGAGVGSLLCNLALDGCSDARSAKKHRRDLDAIAERAFRSQPAMKESFKHYQAASKQIIAKVKALSAEDQAGAYAMLQRDLVAPVTQAARRGDITAVGRSLRKITRKLADQYDVKIPAEHITASEALIGAVAEDDKPYVPSGRVLPPSRSRIDKMLDEPAKPSVPEPSQPVKSAGVGGFGVGLS